jgi:hypothetical protein
MLNRMLSIISLVVVIASVIFFGMSTWLLATWQMAELDGAFALIGCLIAAILFAFRFFGPADFEPLSFAAAVEPKTKLVSPRGNAWMFENRPLNA